MRKLVILSLIAAAVLVVAGGCSSPEDAVVMVVTDNEGIVAPREVTAGYVNDRMLHMPPWMLPEETGDEGKRAFLREIVKKELLVIASQRAAVADEAELAPALDYFRDQRAREMMYEELVVEPSKMTQAEVEDYYSVRNNTYTLQEIISLTLEDAQAARERILKDGDDFSQVAKDVSAGTSARDGGKKPPALWTDVHPLIRDGIKGLEEGGITEVIPFPPYAYYVIRVASIEVPENPMPLEGAHLDRIRIEAERYQQQLLDHKLKEQWLLEANLRYDEDGLAVAARRLEEKIAVLNPPRDTPLSLEERRERAKLPAVPEFTDEEAAMHLVTFDLGGTEYRWTLGDYRDTLETFPGIKTPKKAGPDGVKMAVEQKVREMIEEYQIRRRGYRESREMREYLETRREELLVETFYSKEVNEKIEEPNEEEIRAYYQEHPEMFTNPAKADVKVILVSERDHANRVRQQIVEGGRDFDEMIQEHSIDDWSKAHDGMIEGIFLGQRTFVELQEPAFALEIGEISGPIEIDAGFYVMKVMGRTDAALLPLDEVRGRVVGNIMADRKEARLVEILNELEPSVTVEIKEGNLSHMKSPDEIIAEIKRG